MHIRLGQDRADFDGDTTQNGVPNLVVISQAIEDDNPELARAQELGLEVVRYPEMLGKLMDAQPGIAVAGSHGKSTTAAMIAYVGARRLARGETSALDLNAYPTEIMRGPVKAGTRGS